MNLKFTEKTRLTFSETAVPQEALCLHRSASWRSGPEPDQRCGPTERFVKHTRGRFTFKHFYCHTVIYNVYTDSQVDTVNIVHV